MCPKIKTFSFCTSALCNCRYNQCKCRCGSSKFNNNQKLKLLQKFAFMETTLNLFCTRTWKTLVHWNIFRNYCIIYSYIYVIPNNIHYLEAFFVEPDPEANVDINLLICYTTRTDHIYLVHDRFGLETYWLENSHGFLGKLLLVIKTDH